MGKRKYVWQDEPYVLSFFGILSDREAGFVFKKQAEGQSRSEECILLLNYLRTSLSFLIKNIFDLLK